MVVIWLWSGAWAAGTVVSGMVVTVAATGTATAGAVAGAATIGAAGAGVAMGSGADAGAAAAPAVGAGVVTTFWASAGIQNSDSAAINRRAGVMRTEFGRFMAVLLRQVHWTLGEVCPLRVLDGRGRGGTRSEERRVGKECRSRWS